MIEKLKERDFEATVKLYKKGLLMQNPKGVATLDAIRRELKKINCIVYKKDNKIFGLLSYTNKKPNNIEIEFICSFDKRKGVGSKLIKKLRVIAKKEKKRYIHSTVSHLDKRAIKFYYNLGFKKYKEVKIRKGFKLHKIKIRSEET